MVEGGNEEYDEWLLGSEDICVGRSIFFFNHASMQECSKMLILTQHHYKSVTEETKKCKNGSGPSRHAELAPGMPEKVFSRIAHHLLLLCPSWNGRGLHVWSLYGSSAGPKQTTPIVGDSSRCVLKVCFSSEPLSLYAVLEKAVYLYCNCRERWAADYSLFVIKNMFLITEPLYFFSLPHTLLYSFFFSSPPSLLAEVIAGWLWSRAGRERPVRLFFSSALEKTACVKDWDGLICPVRIGFYCCYCIRMR